MTSLLTLGTSEKNIRAPAPAVTPQNAAAKPLSNFRQLLASLCVLLPDFCRDPNTPPSVVDCYLQLGGPLGIDAADVKGDLVPSEQSVAGHCTRTVDKLWRIW